MKKIFLLIIIFFIFIVGCMKNNISDNQSTYQKINNMLTNLKSYKSHTTIKYISNKNTCEYKIIQYCKSNKYKLKITAPENSAGNITLFDGEKICQFNSKLDGRVFITQKDKFERSEIFLTSFIKNYNKSLETSVEVTNISQKPFTVLEAEIPGDSFLCSEKLFVDNKTIKPKKLIIYDKEQSERIIVNFDDFDYNFELSDSVFEL